MLSASRLGRPNITTIFLLLLSLLSIVNALPQPAVHDDKDLTTRTADPPPITAEQADMYLRKWFPATDHYLLYTGGSTDQVKDFQKQNPGYTSYYDMWTTYAGGEENSEHPLYKQFGIPGSPKELSVGEDMEEMSRAIARCATKQILVFGAAEYKAQGLQSTFNLREVRILLDRIWHKDFESINHMAKNAIRPDQVMFFERPTKLQEPIAARPQDQKPPFSTFDWQKGYTETDTNASDPWVPPVEEDDVISRSSRSSSTSSSSSCVRAKL